MGALPGGSGRAGPDLAGCPDRPPTPMGTISFTVAVTVAKGVPVTTSFSTGAVGPATVSTTVCPTCASTTAPASTTARTSTAATGVERISGVAGTGAADAGGSSRLAREKAVTKAAVNSTRRNGQRTKKAPGTPPSAGADSAGRSGPGEI